MTKPTTKYHLLLLLIFGFLFSTTQVNFASSKTNKTFNYCSPPLEERIEARNILKQLNIEFSDSLKKFESALKNNDKKLVDYFLKAGIIPETGPKNFLGLVLKLRSHYLLDIVLDCINDKEFYIAKGWGPIHIAAANGDTPLLKKLHKKGYSLSRKTKSGKTAYMIADNKVRQFLLKHGVEKPKSDSNKKKEKEVTSEKGNLSLTVKVNHNGKKPKQEYYDSSGNNECGVDRIKNNSVIVNENETLKNVVVFLESNPLNYRREPGTVEINQKKCQFKPRVRTIQVGSNIKFNDSDPGLHTVRGNYSNGRQIFNLQTFKGNSKEETIDNPGLVKLECDVHPWMQGWIVATEHGFSDVTGENGIAKLNDLVAGDYEIKLWHEEYGEISRSVTLKNSSDTTKNNFQINVSLPEKTTKQTIEDVPVQVKNVPADKKITRVDPENLDFTLKGPQSTIDELSASDIAVTVDAPQEPGLVIRGSELQLPEGVELSNRDDSVPAIKIRMEPQ